MLRMFLLFSSAFLFGTHAREAAHGASMAQAPCETANIHIKGAVPQCTQVTNFQGTRAVLTLYRADKTLSTS